MLPNRNRVYTLLSTLCAAVLCGCPTSDPNEPGATEPGPLTTATGVPAETTDTDDETFTPPTTSTTEVEPDPTETSSSTTGDETTTSTTASLDPLWCDAVLEGDETCRVRGETFCDEMVFDADILPEPYRGQVIDKCEDDPCGACFYLANTCVQLLGEKGCGPDLYERCVCLADAHGVV